MGIVYCEKCHLRKKSIDFKKAKEKIEEISEKKVQDNCISFCGPNKDKYIIEIEDDIFQAETFEELIQKIKEYYDNQR